MTEKRQYVTYQYDTETGFIKGTNSSHRTLDDPFHSLPGHFPLTGFIDAIMVTEHPEREHDKHAVRIDGGDWYFKLKNGLPAEDADGHFILIPPVWHTHPPTAADYSNLAHILSGTLDPKKHFHPNYIVGLNRALASAGAMTIPGIEPLPAPERSYICKTAHLKP